MTLIVYDIPPGTPERQCLSCEQPIYWIRTENDRPMCLNPDGQRTATEVASGARLVVDVEFGRGRRLYALSHGVFPTGSEPGSPAMVSQHSGGHERSHGPRADEQG